MSLLLLVDGLGGRGRTQGSEGRICATDSAILAGEIE